jgi:hypothetical protein
MNDSFMASGDMNESFMTFQRRRRAGTAVSSVNSTAAS